MTKRSTPPLGQTGGLPIGVADGIVLWRVLEDQVPRRVVVVGPHLRFKRQQKVDQRYPAHKGS